MLIPALGGPERVIELTGNAMLPGYTAPKILWLKQHEPKNYKALREMGLVLFSAGDYELSRRFFVRAITANPADNASQGYLGCALSRLNRLDEAQKFLARAGTGVWNSCMQRTL